MSIDKTTEREAEIERVLKQANDLAALGGTRFILSERKVRAFGADDAMIDRLRQKHGMWP